MTIAEHENKSLSLKDWPHRFFLPSNPAGVGIHTRGQSPVILHSLKYWLAAIVAQFYVGGGDIVFCETETI